jgi:hypothetical protein
MSTYQSPAVERRQYPRVREVFLQACDFLAPLIAENAQVKTVSNFAMTHILQEHYPDLSTEEIHIVIVTAEKMYIADRFQRKTLP